jgi:hypothetical protein
MKIIRPQIINNTTLLSSNIAEPTAAEPAAWAIGTAYLVGDRVTLVSPSASITVTVANPAVVTWTAHNLANDTPVMFTTTGTLPTGIVVGTIYYVRNRTTNTFELSIKKSGAGISTTGAAGTGHTATAQVHQIYEAFQANTGKYPLIYRQAYWVLIGSTNKWAMFDSGVATQAFNADSITTVLQGVGNSNSVELLNVSADTARLISSNAAAEVAFTVTALTDLINKTAHGLVAGDKITLRSTTTIPAGLVALTTVYFVRAAGLTADAFTVSLTDGGTVVDITNTGTGTHYFAKVVYDTTHPLTASTGQNAWDISTGSYASKSLSVTAQESDPRGVAFSSDGTKAYIVGVTNNTIYQYTLTTAWDISTGSYASKSLSVAAQTIASFALTLSADGTKAYILSGGANDTIYQYTLTTAWDISTGSYASKSLSVAAQDNDPQSISFSSDGTKAYTAGNTSKVVYQYTLTTAWDISTGSYASKSLSVAAQDILPQALFFSFDGTKAYIGGLGTDTIYQYTLSTPWDISSGSYANKSLLVADINTSVTSISFSTDGTKAYTLVNTTDTINQYNIGEYLQKDTLAVLDMPSHTNVRLIVTLTATGKTVLCGELVFGTQLDIGATQYGARLGIKDYSVKQRDDFGNFTVIERAYSKRVTFLVMMDNSYIDYFFSLLAGYRATPVVWIGSEQYVSTHLLGYYIDFSIEIAYPAQSLCSLEIESLT